MSVFEKKFGDVLKEAAVELVNDDAAFARSIDTSKTVVSEKTLRRVRKRIRNYDTTPARARTVSFRRAAVAVLIVCVLSLSLCMSIDAVREKIFDTVVQWYEQFVSVFYVSAEEYPEVIEEYKEPTLIPEGADKEVVFKTDKTYFLKYTKTDNAVISNQQMTFTEYSNDMNIEECDVEKVEINGITGQLFIYESGELTVIWRDDEYIYLINAYAENVSKDRLIDMANSIK